MARLQCFCAWVFGFFFLAVLVSGQTLPASEINALQTIAAKLKISGQKWNFSVNPCSRSPGWVDQPTSNTYLTNNLTCDCNATTSACHVTSIQLKGQNLTGVLPDEFANLTRLTYLDLTRNYISGSIPAGWASLPLTNLALLGNRLSGTIPDALGSMTTLQTLVVEANQLGGPVPASLGNLINLQVLFLSANNFSGELPESLANLKNMTQFRIDGNPITGKIPSFIGNWTQLQRLDLQGTALEGTFPPSFANLSSLIQMSVTDLRGGDGTIPPLQNMKSLNYLVLRNLSISGNLPDYIGDLPISVLDLSYNNLSGSIPSTFADLQNSINFLYLANNLLSGVVPSWILSSNKNFDLSYNNFTEPPLSICQQGNVDLVSSYSSTNNSNSIVPCLQRNLPCLGKRNNYNLFINCGGDAVTIDGNEYEADKISQGQSTYSATSNKWAYSSMGRFMDNGKVSTYIATNVSTLNMTNPELYTNARLTAVSLRYYGLCLQKGNYTVKLHFAEIIYTNDQTYSSVGRRLFDVFIQGQKVLQDFDITKEANGTGKEIVKTFTTIIDGTLEIHFYWAGKGTISIPTRGTYGPLISAISVTPNFKPDTGGSNLSVQAILGIVAASLVVIILILFLLWCCFKRRLSENEKLRRSLESQTGYFSLKQIKVATKNFDPENKIGEGGFGPVYKGVLPDKLEIAVKQLSAKSKQGNREFVNEIGMISALQHPNLVKLLGCCIEGNQLLLIYEYMENNSLARALFGPERNRLKLDWQTRFKICLDVARGLAFLHEESRLKIVHRDIKATNILLDKDLNAKISDFGLARLDEEENTHISTRIAGTVGYMAPEYATRGYLTAKADVYSFGVVALEVVSGVSNTNHRPMEDFVYLLDWAYVLQEQGNLLQLVDPNLGSGYSKEDALQMLNLALMCTNPSPTLRPTMSTVVSMLEGKTPVQILPVKSAASRSEGSRLKAFEKLSYDSQTHSISMDWPSIDSSGSVHSTKEVATSKLISDDSRSLQLRDSDSGNSVFKTSGVDRN